MRPLKTGRLTPYLFVAPMIIGLAVFRLGPLAVAALASFTRWDIRTPPEWLGLANYQELWGLGPVLEGSSATRSRLR